MTGVGRRHLAMTLAALSLLAFVQQAAAFGSASTSLRKLDGLRAQHQELAAKFAATIERIAADARAAGFTEQADAIRTLATPPAGHEVRIEALPGKVIPELPADLPAAQRAWRVPLRAARQEHAAELYRLSRDALHAGLPSYAYQLVQEVARVDSDHAMARRLLGFVRSGDEWVTPFVAEMTRKRMVWHDRFGWLPRTHVTRYERGERYHRRWMPAAQEEALRSDFEQAWEIRTEHFLIKTNHSLEGGVEVAKKLEAYHGFFTQTFAGFFHTPEQLGRLFSEAGSRRSAPRDPHMVHFYKSRDEYLQRLASKSPQIAITTGFYHYGDRVAYFYFDEKADDSVLYHEATHQFLYETSPLLRDVGGDAHFWITEGLACYMESFRAEDGRMSVGDPNYIRFNAARYRYLEDGYYVPFDRFSAMGMQAFQTDPKIAMNYSQASGLAHFFMHYDDGRYRDALVEHLAQLYAIDPRRPRAIDTLPELLELTPADIDEQYGQYVRALARSTAEAGPTSQP
jgi:hypothetical protein